MTLVLSPNMLIHLVLGGSYYTWMHQHFLGHHPYTNVSLEDDEHLESLDPDVVTGDPDVRRIKPTQKWYNYYRYQAVRLIFFTKNLKDLCTHVILVISVKISI